MGIELTSEDWEAWRLATSKKLVFVSEHIENIAPGWRARETYLILNENEFIERSELAEPGKDFALHSEAHLKRTTQPSLINPKLH